jgi:hypothetical protein
MDAHVEQLLARVAADDSGADFIADDWERLYHVATFACSKDGVPAQDEVKTRLMIFGCAEQKATVLSHQLVHLCGMLGFRGGTGGR